jgi:pyrroloquinoline quinone (PQQ) biosynthesis protein C
MEILAHHSTAYALRTKFALAAPALRAAAAELWRPRGLDRRYPEYLVAMHGVVRASVPLMELAARRCVERESRDPVAGPLRGYLERHVEEERDHDEWLLDDLAALGADPERILARQPSPIVARLVGAQYYWIAHHHPVALLGYIAVLEENSPTVRLADWIVRAAGVPEAAVRTVREHADLDPGHTDEIFALLDALPLTRSQASGVAISGLHTIDALAELLTRLSRTSLARQHRTGTELGP